MHLTTSYGVCLTVMCTQQSNFNICSYIIKQCHSHRTKIAKQHKMKLTAVFVWRLHCSYKFENTNTFKHYIFMTTILAAIVLVNHSQTTRIEISTRNHPGWIELVHGKNKVLVNNFNRWCDHIYMHLGISMTI